MIYDNGTPVNYTRGNETYHGRVVSHVGEDVRIQLSHVETWGPCGLIASDEYVLAPIVTVADCDVQPTEIDPNNPYIG